MTQYTRIALDIGTTSIGWALLKTTEQGEPTGIIKTGVRIFNNGRDDKTDAPLNQKRQSVRSARRRQDRTVARRKKLLNTLVKYGFMPENKDKRKELATLDPYEIRHNALNQSLSPHHVGRAFFHINQGRGFKSNRKQKGDNKEGGAIKTAIEKTQQLLVENKSKTIGEFLYNRKKDEKHVKIRNISGKDTAFKFDFYLQRQMLEQEFCDIWKNQKSYHPRIYTNQAYEDIKDTIFYQRPLKSKQEHIGTCTLFPAESRASKALPIYQNFRIVQDIINLAYIDEQGYDHKIIAKSPEVFHKLYNTLKQGKNLTWDQIKKALLKADIISDTRLKLNFESDTRKGFDGNEVAHTLATKKNAPLTDKWHTWDLEKQTNLIKILLDEDLDDIEAVKKIQDEYGLDKSTAEAILNADLPDGYGNLCEKALNALHPIMLHQGLRYDQAIQEAYPDLHHSNLNKTDGSWDKLPYYAQELQEHCTGGHGDTNNAKNQYFNKHIKDIQTWGRIANPTVHIGLIQLQAVINDIIRIHGKPNFATVEFARDLKNTKKQKENYNKIQKNNKENNNRWAKELTEDFKQKNNRENRLRMRLWYELNWDNCNDRRCPYTGKQIGREMLFSDKVEIEHIIPYSKTLDDSPANKTLAIRSANRFKGNRSPYEAFGQSPDGYDWGDIYTRAQKLPKNKCMRFSPNAMEKYANETKVQDRQLNDTRYLSKVAKKYLGLVIHPDNIHVIPGQLTAMLRGKWGLDETLHKKEKADDTTIYEKNRNDHRHHALDAVVIGCTTRGMLQKISTLSAQNSDDKNRLLSGLKEPWDTFRDDVKDSIQDIIVSHKPDPYPQGQLHEETFYGKVKDTAWDKEQLKGKEQFVIRKPVTLKNFGDKKKIEEIRDPHIRQDLLERFHFAARPNDWIERFISDTGIRKVRIVQEKEKLIKIGNKHVKGGNNFAIDIYYDPENPKKWMGEIIQAYHANKKGYIPDWQNNNPTYKHIMRLHKKDMVAMTINNTRCIMKLQKMDSPSALHFVLHSEANAPSRDKELRKVDKWKTTAVSHLKSLQIRKVHISPSGLWREQDLT